MGAMVMMVGEVAQPARVRQDLLETSVPVMDIGTTAPVGDIPITAEFKDPQTDFETVHGMPVYYGGDLNDSDYESPGVMIMTPGRTGVILTFETGIVGFSRTTRKHSCLL